MKIDGETVFRVKQNDPMLASYLPISKVSARRRVEIPPAIYQAMEKQRDFGSIGNFVKFILFVYSFEYHCDFVS